MRNAIDRPAIVCAALAVATACAGAAGVRPFGTDRPVQIDVRYYAPENAYRLQAVGGDTVVYSVDLDDADLAAGMLRIAVSLNGRASLPVLAKAGTRYRSAADVVMEPEEVARSAGALLVEHRVEGQAVVLRYRERPGAHLLEKTYRLSLAGIALVVEFSSPSTWGLDGYAGVSLGRAENAAGARVVHLPYLPEPVALLPGGPVMTAYIDPMASSSVTITNAAGTRSDGTVYAHGRTKAEPDTAGAAVPLSEAAYVTVSEDLIDVLPRVVGPTSPYRSALSWRLVLDVWGLHHAFSSREGVALSWRSPEAGAARLSILYADANPACGDGIALFVWHNDRLLDRLNVRNGATAARIWERTLALAVGDTVRCEIDRAGSHACDGTRLEVTIDTPAGLFGSLADFASTQGHRGFSYLEYVGGVDTPMTWDPAAGRWKGAGGYSLFWRGGGHPGRSTTDAADARAMVRRYDEYGLAEIAIIFHVWQRWGYDQGLPDHFPAHPDMGGDAAMAAFVAAARDAGMLVCLHENYTDMYPNNPPQYPSPLWDASALALDRRGNRKLGWYQPETRQQAFQIAADRMQGLAAAESSSMAAAYRPNAAYLDVTTGYRPDWTIDHSAANESDHSLAHATRAVIGLFEAMKAIHGGPLFGEGGGGGSLRFDSYFAGFVDAVERQSDRRSREPVAPLFELVAIKPRMLNHGMGYYSRYFPDAGQRSPAQDEADLDQYRASNIAFGHAGFMGDTITDVRNWLRLHGPEYWLMQALQSRYAEAEVVEIAYHDGAGFVDTESALRNGMPLAAARIRIAYANGLVVHVNRDAPARRASSVGDFSHEQGLDSWGYYEDRGAGLVPLAWDLENQRWQGSRTYMQLDRFGGHPDGGAVVRTFTVPADALLTIQGSVEDGNLNCGDGAEAQILHNGRVLCRCLLPGDVAAPCSPFDLHVPAATGDVIAFRIEEKANNLCDTTLFTASISWDDGEDHDWAIEASDGPRTLAPSGFHARDPSGFRAFTARLGVGPEKPVVDYVASPEYHFARSRDGRPATIEEFLTDGGIAVVHRALGDDLHGLELTEASFGSQLLLRSTMRCDVNLRHVHGRGVLVAVRDLTAGATADVTWGALPATWRTALEDRRGTLELRAADDDGNRLGDPLPMTYDGDGNPVLVALVEGCPYVVELAMRAATFVRGDANADGGVNIGDAVLTLAYLFGGAADGGCQRALDGDDSGHVDIGDAIYLLAYLFAAGPSPAPPSAACGADETEDGLSCLRFPPCR